MVLSWLLRLTFRLMSLKMSLLFSNRLVKEGLCDKTTAPSVSAISRLLRGRDDDEPVKKKEEEEQGKCGLNGGSYTPMCHDPHIMAQNDSWTASV